MRRATTRIAVTALAVVIGTAGATSAASRKAAPSHHPAVYIAHLQLHLASTSRWTTIELFPGVIVSSKLSKATGPGVWHVGSTALTMTGGTPGQRSSVTANLIYDDLATEPDGHLTLQKDVSGLTHVVVQNVSGKHPFLVRRATDDVHSSGDPNNTLSVGLQRSQVMGHQAASLPRADPRRLVLAFYYPWYHSYDQPNLADHPRHPRSTFSKAGVASMTAQAKAHGIDGFIESWAGRHNDGKQLRLALEAARARHQVVTGYLESAIAASHGSAAEAAELHWLAQLLHFSHNPAFLKTKGGVPVVFVYQMTTFSPAQWVAILHRVRHATHQRVRLVGDSMSAPYRRLEWGVHYYGATGSEADLRNISVADSAATKARAALHPGVRPQLFAAPVSPGFDDHKLRGGQDPVVPRAGGQHYLQTWRGALSGEPDWILVTSWNEWFEDTEVEPGQGTGSQALALTRQQAARWKRH